MKRLYNDKKLSTKIMIRKFLDFIIVGVVCSYLTLLGCSILVPEISYLLRIFPLLVVSGCILQFVEHIVDDKVYVEFNDLCTDIYRDYDIRINNSYYRNVNIIPKNIKVGENLEGVDAIPIFKKGKYIIIPNGNVRVVLAEYEEENKHVVDLLECDDIEEIKESFTPRQLRLVYPDKEKDW